MTEPKAYIIEFLSKEWTRNCLWTLFIMVTYLFIGKRISAKYQLQMGIFISVLLISTTITGHTRNIINGHWNIIDNFVHFLRLVKFFCIVGLMAGGH